MASGLEPAAPSPVTPLPAPGRGEHWWPVALAIIVVAGLHVALPAKYRGNPPWVGPAVLLALLAALVIGDPGRIDRQKTWLRIITGTLIAFITVANLFAAAHLVHDILTSNKLYASNATGLLATGGVIWATNVIAFGLWYWEFDRGGPVRRAEGLAPHPDLMFPQMASPELAPPEWEPYFVDYLYMSFTNATAFSPTDVMPLARWAKVTMAVQSAVALLVGVLVIARAVNILTV